MEERLQAQLKQLQQEKPSRFRLPDVAVIELVHNIKNLGIVDLIYTMDGREYLTPARLQEEIVREVLTHGGRVSTVDLPALLNVEQNSIKQACSQIKRDDIHSSNLELVTDFYITSMAEEVEEILRESGRLSITDIVSRFELSSHIVEQMIEKHLGKIIHAKQQRDYLVTSSYEEDIRAMVRGIFTGITSPTNITTQILPKVTIPESLLMDILQDLMTEGRILGKVTKGIFQPSSFSRGQQDALESFFSQNSFISFEHCLKLGLGQGNPGQFLSQKFNSIGGCEGVALHDTFVSLDSVAQLDASVEEGFTQDGWADISSAHSIPLTNGDYTKIFSLMNVFIGKQSQSSSIENEQDNVRIKIQKGEQELPLFILAGKSRINYPSIQEKLSEIPAKTPESVNFQCLMVTGPMSQSCLTPLSLVKKSQKHIGVTEQMLNSAMNIGAQQEEAVFKDNEQGHEDEKVVSDEIDNDDNSNKKGKQKGKNHRNQQEKIQTQNKEANHTQTVDPISILYCKMPFTSAYGQHTQQSSGNTEKEKDGEQSIILAHKITEYFGDLQPMNDLISNIDISQSFEGISESNKERIRESLRIYSNDVGKTVDIKEQGNIIASVLMIERCL
ncbi:MAG: putative E3 UFM1-protein ligase 1, partial [Streblomastix strix]